MGIRIAAVVSVEIFGGALSKGKPRLEAVV
jgi:hypothetical protein